MSNVFISETPVQSKPVASPAAHSLLSNGSSGGKLSMGPHHYTPIIPNTNMSQPHYNSLVSFNVRINISGRDNYCQRNINNSFSDIFSQDMQEANFKWHP